MIDPLPVQVVFQGEPFDRSAVLHTLRHLAMRVGWVLCPDAEHRLVYATLSNPAADLALAEGEIAILSSPLVGLHLAKSHEPIPLHKTNNGHLLPFPHPAVGSPKQIGGGKEGIKIEADVVAGAYATFNLWYECQTRPLERDGWIRWADDWMAQIGLSNPQPLADEWLNLITTAAVHAGWPTIKERGGEAGSPYTLVLTHDVDYLPGKWNRGVPRLVRSMMRQVISRRRPGDALQTLIHYARILPRRNPYFDLPLIATEEDKRNARSSFQLTVAQHHLVDPAYNVGSQFITDALRQLQASDWEICLHGSYTASRTAGRLAAERSKLEDILNLEVVGHRQHYLNFHPSQLFHEVERAGLKYDLSVGYNDRSGPRAGTLFPYRPYDTQNSRPYDLWEIPFVLMDTTLATTDRLSGQKAWQYTRAIMEQHQGCAAVIWHQEQLGGLLDPGFDDVYYRLLDYALEKGIRLVPGGALLPELDKTWNATMRGYDVH